MAKKSGKRNDPDAKELAKKATKLQARLEKTGVAKAAWKAKAKRSEAKVTRLQAKAKRLQSEVERFRSEARRFEAETVKMAKQLKKVGGPRQAESRSVEDIPELAVAAEASTPPASGVPDESWTVTRLRASAREAGVPGYSRMTRAALLSALTRSGEDA